LTALLRVVAIDGAAGSGKSTLARHLARALGLPYVNTGLMYRALTLEALRRGLDMDDGPSLAELMGTLRFSVEGSDPAELWIEGAAPDDALHGEEVEARVSALARHPEVRTAMRGEQRELGGSGAVMEGRDIGSVIFPEAPVKLYLIADPGIRAERRAQERPEGERMVADALHRRDADDKEVNPFRPTDGAVTLDTTSLDPQAALAAAMDVVRRLAPELLS
jgi:cytidylate kinase